VVAPSPKAGGGLGKLKPPASYKRKQDEMAAAS